VVTQNTSIWSAPFTQSEGRFPVSYALKRVASRAASHLGCVPRDDTSSKHPDKLRDMTKILELAPAFLALVIRATRIAVLN
jgi:hypothetical protein